MRPSFAIWLCLIGLFSRIVSGQNCALWWPFIVPGNVCAVDPINDSYLEYQIHILIFGCGGANAASTASYTADVTYTNTLNQVITVTAPSTITAPLSVETVLTFDFPVPFTSIKDGTRVTQGWYAKAPPAFTDWALVIYTQTHSQSIFFAQSTSTQTIFSGVDQPVFTTITDFEPLTVPGPTVTATSITGVNTITIARPTITNTITFTLSPQTIQKVSIVTVTTTLSCVPRGSKRRRDTPRRGGLIAARVAATSYENVNCHSIVPTTIWTDTTVVPFVTTTTNFITTPVQLVVTTTVTADPVTSYLSAISTSTVTPSPKVKTKVTIASRVVVTSTKWITVTHVIIPTGPPPQC